jgi:hypothetical protein
VAALFPAMHEIAYIRLKASIQEHGQLEPIVVDGSILLDGRHRHLACEELGIEPKVIEYSALALSNTPDEWVFAVNIHRRSLTEDQKLALLVTFDTYLTVSKAKPTQEHAACTDQKASAPNLRDSKRENGRVAEIQEDEFPSRNRDGKSPLIPKRGRPAGDGNGRACELLAKASGQTRYRAEGILKLACYNPGLLAAVKDRTLSLRQAMAQLRTEQARKQETELEQPPAEITIQNAVSRSEKALSRQDQLLLPNKRSLFWRQIAELATERAKLCAANNGSKAKAI